MKTDFCFVPVVAIVLGSSCQIPASGKSFHTHLDCGNGRELIVCDIVKECTLFCFMLSFAQEMAMPEISRFFGIVIKMLYEAGGKHNKPHVHVEYGEYEASVGIDGEVLAGVLPEKQYKLVAAWLTLHEEELYEAWNNAVQMKQLPKIRPLS